MNIRQIHSAIRRPAARALAFAAATAVTVAISNGSFAQTGYQQALPFGPGTQIVPASSVRTAADLQSGRLAPGSISQAVNTVVGDISAPDFGSIAQVNYGCQSCSSPACGGGCNSFGTASGYGGYATSNACGIPCNPYRYLIVEGLFMQRQGSSGYSNIRGVGMDEFNFEWAPRITLGSLPNCVNGYEVTWTGAFDFDRSSSRRNTAGGINTNLRAAPAPAFDPTLISPFFDSTVQTQTYTSEYYSLEASKTLVGWDVAKVLFGGRYINIDEDYRYAATDTAGDSGLLSSGTENDLLGLQVGLDLLYPVSQHLYSDLRVRAGGYANFAQTDVQLAKNSNVEILRRQSETELAGVFELGTGLRYQVGEMLSLRAGGEFWYITGVATAPDQFSRTIDNNLGSRADVEDDLFYYGLTVGAELRF